VEGPLCKTDSKELKTLDSVGGKETFESQRHESNASKSNKAAMAGLKTTVHPLIQFDSS
jgi:hypothetical protein